MDDFVKVLLDTAVLDDDLFFPLPGKEADH